MDNKAVQYGLIYGIITIILTMITYFIGPSFYSKWMNFILLMIAGIILTIIVVTMAMKDRKKSQGGYLSFKEGFQTGFITVLVAILVSTIFSIVFFNFIDPGYATQVQNVIVDSTTEMMEKFGAPDAQIDEAIAKAEKNNPFSIASQLKNVVSNLIFSSIIVLIIAAIVKKKRPEAQEVDMV